MAFALPSRVYESFTTEGTGTITLLGAVTGYRTFASALSNGDTVFYFLTGGSDWEIGYGTYTGGTLARTTVIKSSNSNNAVSWAAGTKYAGIAPIGPSEGGNVLIKPSPVASAGTVTLTSGTYVHITGTTTITDVDFSPAADGSFAWVIFDGALTLTHNATTLILPGGANITTAAGDRALFVQDASDNVYCAIYERASGFPIKPTLPSSTTDNTVPRFDSTAGNIQTSGVTINDSDTLRAGGVGVGSASYTIASGAITITKPGLLIVDTEGAAATDDLDTVTLSGATAGDIIIICASDNARDVVVKDGTGNMRTAGDFTLNHSQDAITLIFRGSGVWCEMSRSDNTP